MACAGSIVAIKRERFIDRHREDIILAIPRWVYRTLHFFCLDICQNCARPIRRNRWSLCQQCDDLLTAQDRSYLANLEALRRMPYRQYLRTDHWQMMRVDRLAAARNRCELCFSSQRLNVHHKTYERRGHESPWDLIVLRGNCHALFHGKLPEVPS